jgi:cytoskeletal protein CcmA (bactofilin family)
MFGRKPPSGGDSASTPDRIAPVGFQTPERAPAAAARPVAVADPQAAPAPRPVPPPPAWGAAGPAGGQQPPQRRPAEPIRPADVARTEPARDIRKLIVGRDINLSGEITACDHLIVEGTVEARVRDCYRLEVAESGLFQGSVEIREADIAGRFLGELIVQGRLSVRATGKVEGKIQYGELAVDAGGTLDGEVRVNDKSPRLVADSESAKPAIETKAAEAPVAEASVEPPSLL